MNIVRPTVLMTISLAPFTSYTSQDKKSGKREEHHLQQQQSWAFIQKLHYSRIGSSCSGLK